MCSIEHANQIVVSLALCATIKFILTLITFGLKMPGGVFVPSLIIGALYGRALGFGVEALHHAYGDNYVFEVCAHTYVITLSNSFVYCVCVCVCVLRHCEACKCSYTIILSDTILYFFFYYYYFYCYYYYIHIYIYIYRHANTRQRASTLPFTPLWEPLPCWGGSRE
jgi:hypothetical protein